MFCQTDASSTSSSGVGTGVDACGGSVVGVLLVVGCVVGWTGEGGSVVSGVGGAQAVSAATASTAVARAKELGDVRGRCSQSVLTEASAA